MDNTAPTWDGTTAQAVRPRYIVAGLSVLLLLVGFIAVGAFTRFGSDIQTRQSHDLQAIASGKQAQIDGYLLERFLDAQFLAQNPLIWQALQAHDKVPLASPQQTELNTLLNATLQAYQYRRLILFNTRLQAVMPAQIPPLNASQQQAFDQALKTGLPTLVDLHDCGSGQTCLGVAQPVHDAGNVQGTVLGLAYLEVDARTHLFPILLLWPSGTGTGESLLVGKQGNAIVGLSPLRQLPDAAPLTVKFSADQTHLLSAQALNLPGQVITEAVDYQNKPVVGLGLPIARTPWLLMVKVDRDEMLAPVRTLGLAIVIVSVLLMLLLSGGAVLLWRMLIARARAVNAQLYRRYQAANKASIDGYSVLNESGYLLECNGALTRMTGWTAMEMLGQPQYAFYRDMTPEQMAQHLAQVRQAGAGRFRAKRKTKTHDDLDVELSLTWAPAQTGGTFHEYVRDIGPELLAQRQIERLNAFYVFLQNANAAARRTQEPLQVLDAVCAAAVRDGDFLLAWAGVPDPATGIVRVVSSHGPAKAYGDSLRITLDPALPTSHGPSREAMVQGHIVYTGDFQNDAMTAPWAQAGKQYGLRASAAVPITVDGQAVAVITLYSADLNHFDNEVRNLVSETATMVSLAWQTAAALQARASTSAALEMSESRFEKAFDASPVPMQITSLQTRKTRALNQAHRRTFGYSLADIPDEQSWFERAYPDPAFRQAIALRWNQDLQAASQSGQAMPSESPEITVRCKDGQERIVRGFMSRSGDDIVIQWEDLTESRRKQAQLIANEQRFRNLVEQSITGMCAVQNGRVVYANPRLESIVGWSAQELVGQNPASFVDDSVRDSLIASMAGHGAADGALNGIYPVRRRDGKLIDLEVQVVTGQWEDAAALFLIVQDVSERKHAQEQIAAYVKQLEGSMEGALQAVARMVELRDPYTAGHERRVGLLAAAIAQEMGWEPGRCENLKLIGLVHDIGKIAIPAEILSKPTRLTPLEYEIVKTHAEKGYEILRDMEFPLPIAEIIREHHERLDGSGYPQGLKGEQIMAEARVLAVADVIESMASHRPYRPALGMDIALKEIESHRSLWFDPEVTDAALRLIREKGYALPA